MNLFGVGRNCPYSGSHRSSSRIDSRLNILVSSKRRSLFEVFPQFAGVVGKADQAVMLGGGRSVHLLLEAAEFGHGAVHHRVQILLGLPHLVVGLLGLVLGLELEIGPSPVRLDFEQLHEILDCGGIEGHLDMHCEKRTEDIGKGRLAE
ncbi:chlorophyll a-b binding protein of LHCII type I [Striga asiatica]|uniref:Chlorophyll a-b binding protein of LHCII type I n=1 Tax=Striga asiatica TaxID=4170 RepID=A0A5A7NW14_STRAF|nr:chlorophyll a-b binding protein of LHCII type I [Striga asiatica]